ncbi:MAG: hypothetical protein ACRCZE_03425, partial [Candidatus Altimarinota bacterium]
MKNHQNEPKIIINLEAAKLKSAKELLAEAVLLPPSDPAYEGKTTSMTNSGPELNQAIHNY